MAQELHKVGPFILGKTIGSGATGKVKVAFHKDTGEKVAIKIIDKEYLSSKPTMRKKIEREIAIMKLVKNPNVLMLYDVYENDQFLFLVLELAEGGELFDYLVARGSLDPSEALKIFQQIIEGLEYCHSNLICHRDLKPENLLLDSQQNIKLADFGMGALMRQAELLETSCGSPHYASPEVVMGIKYDGRAADIWSCGVILFALLTGKLPFDDEDMRKLLGKVKNGTFSMPQYLHKDIKDILSRMLTVDPAKRITLKEIKEHNFYKSKKATKPPVITVEELLDDCIPICPEEDVDADIIRSLVCLGWGTEQEVREALLAGVPNYETVFYRLLEDRKKNPYSSSPRKAKVKTRQRTNTISTLSTSAPALDISLQKLLHISATPPPVATSASSPPTVIMERRGSIGGGESPLARVRRNRTKSLGGNVHPHFPKTNKIHLQDGQVFNEGSPPNLGSPIITHFSKIRDSKDEASISSSPKRNSWFTTFIDNIRGSNSQKSGSNLVIQSNKTTMEIVSEVERALDNFGVRYKYNSSRDRIKASYALPDGSFAPIKFHITIGKGSGSSIGSSGNSSGNSSSSPSYAIGILRRSGDRHLFREVCNRLQASMNL